MPLVPLVNRWNPAHRATLAALLPQGNPSRHLQHAFQWPGTLGDDTFQPRTTRDTRPPLPDDRAALLKTSMGADDTTVIINSVTIVSQPGASKTVPVRPFLSPNELFFLNGIAQKNGYLTAQEMWQHYYNRLHQTRRLADGLAKVREKLSWAAEVDFTQDLAKRVKSTQHQMSLYDSDCPDGLTLPETMRLTAALLPSLGFEATRADATEKPGEVIVAYRPIPKTEPALFEYLNELDHHVLFPQLASTSAGAIDFMQGNVGNCWVLSPLYAVLNHPVTQKALLDRITLPKSPNGAFQTTWYQRGRNNAIAAQPINIDTAAEHLVQAYRKPTEWLDNQGNTWRRGRVVGPLGIRLLETAFDLYQGRVVQPIPVSKSEADSSSRDLNLWDTLDQQYRERQPFTGIHGGDSLQSLRELAHGFKVFSLDEMPWHWANFFDPPANKTQVPLWRRVTPKSRDRGALVDDPELQESSHLWALYKLFGPTENRNRFIGVASTQDSIRLGNKALTKLYQQKGLTPHHTYAMGSVDSQHQEIAWVNPHNTTKPPVVLSFRESVTLLRDMAIVDTTSS